MVKYTKLFLSIQKILGVTVFETNIDNNKEISRRMGVIDNAIKVMNRHIDDPDVCGKACGTIWNILSLGKTTDASESKF